MVSQVVLIASNNDMFSEQRVVVEGCHTIEFSKYVEPGKRLLGVFKLTGKDFSKLEEKYEMPEGTIGQDISAVSGLSIRQRFTNGGQLLLVHHGDSEGLSIEEYEAYLNNMSAEELRKFIKEGKI